MNTSEIKFNELNILHICNKNLKNSYINIKKNGQIILKTPRISDTHIKEILLKKESWIKRHLEVIKQNPKIEVNLEDEVLLFGEIFSIDVNEAEKLRYYLQNLRIETKENITKCYDRFYKEYAGEYIIPRIEHFSRLMGLRYNNVKFRKMRRRWGSCTSKGDITINSELIKLDKKLIDLIVVHEIAHLKYMNHSKRFHSLVSKYIPDYHSLNQRLKHLPLLG